VTWPHVEGGVKRGETHTVVSVGATTEHGSYGQTVAIANHRYDDPAIYRRTLDFLVRDIGQRVDG
jgi:hypothetical protein